MRLHLICSYEGSAFTGWQSQPGGGSVQDALERAFEKMEGHAIRVHGAGRTDAGVHALAQSAHVDVERTLDARQWRLAINAHLPPEVRLTRVRFVGRGFHARFSAIGKTYAYEVENSDVRSPFLTGRAWNVPQPLDFARMRAAAEVFVGTHDFQSFRAMRHDESDADCIRSVRRIDVTRQGTRIRMVFEGDGFLYKMVRMLSAALVRSGRGLESPEDWAVQLANPGTSGRRLVAPAHGLYLLKVRYRPGTGGNSQTAATVQKH